MQVEYCSWNEFLDPKSKIAKNKDAIALGSWGEFHKFDSKNFENKIKFLLKNGSFYFLGFGSDGEVIHDSIDDINAYEDAVNGNEYEIMTTWHDEDTPEDFAFYFLNLTRMDDRRAWRGLIVSDFKTEYDREVKKEIEKQNRKTKEDFWPLFHQALSDKISFTDFEQSFMDVWELIDHDKEFPSDESSDFLEAINYKLSFAHEEVEDEERKDGLVNFRDFKEWLQDKLKEAPLDFGFEGKNNE